MSDQRLIVPSETPSACAACEVDKPSGLPLMFLIALFQRVLDGMKRIVPQLHNIRQGTKRFRSVSGRSLDRISAYRPPGALPRRIIDTSSANAKRGPERARPPRRERFWMIELPSPDRTSA